MIHIYLISQQKKNSCVYSLEAHWQDAFNEYPQQLMHVFVPLI